MRLENFAASTKEGGFQMIDFDNRLKAIKLASVSQACNQQADF